MPIDVTNAGDERASGPDRDRLRFLLSTAEEHPTYRADVRVLFGKFLPRFGIDTDLVAVSPESAEVPPWGGGRVLTRRFASRLGFVRADLMLQLSLLKRCFQGYDGLIVRDKPILGLVGLVAARLARIPFIYWMSFPLPEAYLTIAANADGTVRPQRRLYCWLRGRIGHLLLYRVLVPSADYLFVQSPVMLEQLRGKGLRHARAMPVPMAVDAEAVSRRAPAADPAGAGSPHPRSAVYLGTLSPLRRQELEVMIDAAKEVGSRCPDFVLLVIGEADTESEKGWLKRYAESVGADPWVRFLGWVPFEEGLALASTCAIGLSPCPRGELYDCGSPTKPVEYMALGLPVVCNDQPDQAYVVRESAAGLCVELTATAFATAILQLLADPARIAAMGERGRVWVRGNRDYAEIARAVAAALRGAIRRRRHG